LKRWARGAALFLSVAAIQGSAQSALEVHNGAQETQARGFWTDPSTGLMWAAKDNGKDVTWNKAMKYCRELRLAGYSDWRLANMAELQGIYDRTANAPGLGVHEIEPTTWHVKGNLFLTAYQWSSNDILDDRGRPSGYAYYFDFNEGKPDETQKGYSTYKHALCARGSGK
jgi:hypothetical protein